MINIFIVGGNFRSWRIVEFACFRIVSVAYSHSLTGIPADFVAYESGLKALFFESLSFLLFLPWKKWQVTERLCYSLLNLLTYLSIPIDFHSQPLILVHSLCSSLCYFFIVCYVISIVIETFSSLFILYLHFSWLTLFLVSWGESPHLMRRTCLLSLITDMGWVTFCRSTLFWRHYNTACSSSGFPFSWALNFLRFFQDSCCNSMKWWGGLRARWKLGRHPRPGQLWSPGHTPSIRYFLLLSQNQSLTIE